MVSGNGDPNFVVVKVALNITLIGAQSFLPFLFLQWQWEYVWAHSAAGIRWWTICFFYNVMGLKFFGLVLD